MKAPKAKKDTVTHLFNDDVRTDNYHWLKDINNPEVIKYLEAENLYTNYQMQDTEALQNIIFEEMKARYQKDEESIPYFFNGYWLYIRYEDELEYPIFCRKEKSLLAEEEIILNVNHLAENFDYYEVNQISISKNNQLLAFSFDDIGNDVYTIDVKTILNDEFLLTNVIKNTSGKIIWADDNEHFYYVKLDKALRPYEIYLHNIFEDQSKDTLIYSEKDEQFNVDIYKSKSQEFIFIVSSSGTSDEHYFIPSNNIFSQWILFQERTPGLEYSVEHFEDVFYIINNADDAVNFKISVTPLLLTQKQFWKDLVEHQNEVLIEGIEVFKNYLVVEERKEGLLYIKIMPRDNSDAYFLEFSEETYNAYLGVNLDFDTDVLRFSYSSLTQPTCTYEFNMKDKTRVLIKQTQVLDVNFRSENYISKRIWANSYDEKKIAISLVYHKDFPPSDLRPLLLYAYGSYGISIDASFSSSRLSLLDRGFTYAIAHVRGGEYLGREWYNDGKLLNKKNTFLDYIFVANHLINNSFTSSKHLYGLGGSAGGLLIGVVMNLYPELFNGLIAEVPFVDVLSTMLDDKLPLTIGEYQEWGNPNIPIYYNYIKSYSPYDNVAEKKYPNLLVTTALNDTCVPYWEAAKWVAKLRDYYPDDKLLMLKTEMDTGHSGASGRFESLNDEVLQLAFLLKLENKTK